MTDRELPLNMQKRFLAAQSVLGVDEPSGLMPEDYIRNMRPFVTYNEKLGNSIIESPWKIDTSQSEAAWKAQDFRDQNKLLALKLMLLDQE